EALTTWMHFFHNYVHCAMYLLGLLLSLSAGCEHYWSLPPDSPALARLRMQRHLTEPPLWASLGLLLVSHVHDNVPIIKLSHTLLGYMFLLLAGLQACSALACDGSVGRPIPRVLRACNAFAWLLPGVWLLHM
ncbi:MAG: hypothetical protein SGPRY_006306, partial [Prymnesium sp.]